MEKTARLAKASKWMENCAEFAKAWLGLAWGEAGFRGAVLVGGFAETETRN